MADCDTGAPWGDLARKCSHYVPFGNHEKRNRGQGLRTVRRLAQAGIPIRVMLSPIVPGLTDHEVEAIVAAARDAGAVAASMIPLRLPPEVSQLWQDWLAEHYPDRVGRVMSKLRDKHGGKDYDAKFGKRMRCEGIWVDLLQQRFRRAVRAAGLAEPLPPRRSRRPVALF